MYLFTSDCSASSRDRLMCNRSERLPQMCFAHTDCLTVDEMEKYTVYDSLARIVGNWFTLLFLCLFFFFLLSTKMCCIFPLKIRLHPLPRVSPVLIRFCRIKHHIFADTCAIFLFSLLFLSPSFSSLTVTHTMKELIPSLVSAWDRND